MLNYIFALTVWGAALLIGFSLGGGVGVLLTLLILIVLYE